MPAIKGIVSALPLAFALAAVSAGAHDLPPPATGLDAEARARLVGEHLLTLQWLGWGDLSQAGTATIRDDGGALAVAGRQEGTGENAGDYLEIAGKIVSADRDGFVFAGEILTKVNHLAQGAECRREGTFHFKATGKRRYWRLQEMDNPCDTATDYVDLYFLGI
ncbi:hypothetical protein [Luteimonas aquatica]|uniref:hypothetical protein n=1 Tax=Luteimonas aquatica TaxID=450364 RepID=UPI001F579F17|nr:hypothetical protein [Luteimonas aquatica]